MLPEDYSLRFAEWTRLLDAQHKRAADTFYFARILPAILPTVRIRSGTIPKYDGLISLLGFTPETVVLTSLLLKPDKLVILHTPETQEFIDVVKTHSGVPLNKISNEEFLHDDEHIDDIYIALRKALDQFTIHHRIAIELTGGKKTMGIQLSNAAAAIRHNQKWAVDIVYIDYDEYMPKYRKPLPETSRLLIVGDPPASAETVFSRPSDQAVAHRLEKSSDKRGIVAYPIFQGRNYPLKQDLAFTLMPFREPWSDRIWKIIQGECAKKSFQVVRADDLYGHDIMEDIWMSILQARVLIADITNRNPNVFYELGIAHTIGKRVILLTQNIQDIPFDLNRYRHVIYQDNAEGYEKLVRGLKNMLSNSGC
jgi:hypothetical protein